MFQPLWPPSVSIRNQMKNFIYNVVHYIHECGVSGVDDISFTKIWRVCRITQIHVSSVTFIY